MENQKFNVQLWLNHNRQKDNQSQLFIRIVVDGKRAEIATTYYVKKSDWDNLHGRVKAKAPHSVLTNGFIDHSLNEIKKHFLSFAAFGKNVKVKEL